MAEQFLNPGVAAPSGVGALAGDSPAGASPAGAPATEAVA